MRTTIIALLTVFAIGPAAAQSTTSPTAPSTSGGMAQSQADCQANWKAADTNNDGRLDSTEMSASKALLPTSLSSSSAVSQAEFMTACNTTVQGQKK